MNSRAGLLLSGAAALAGAALALPLSASAQPVVQALPNPAQQRLNDALRTLGQDPHSVRALTEAGQASIGLGDLNAAAGFFRRAEAVAPADGGVKAGLAAIAVRQGQALEALRLFAEAEAAGEPMQIHAAERGLAYDLVGDTVHAQEQYQVSLAIGADPEVVRRMALSQAIAGNQAASEATLLPLLQGRDLAAYRTRAFALAILGKDDEAVSIAETMLPERLSGRLAPYLRYMPRLTRAQQAAAGNLGIFPRAAEIGRDDPAVAAYAASIAVPAPVRTADARLVPNGAPLGRRESAAAPAPSPAPAPAPQAAASTPQASAAPDRVYAVAPAPAPQPTPAPPPAMVQAVPTPTPAPAATVQAVPTPTPTPAATVQAVPTPTPPPAAVAQAQPAPAPAVSAATPVATASEPPIVGPVDEEAPVVVAALPGAAPSAEPPRPSISLPAPPPEQADLAAAFADFTASGPTPQPIEGAVDITTIQPRREAPPRPATPAPPPRPVQPSRQWVQVATGRDTAALEFDWRRIKRSAGGLLDKYKPYVAAWGQTNRLVAGPFASAAEAQDFVAKLKGKQLDSFRFTSAQGEEVRPLE